MSATTAAEKRAADARTHARITELSDEVRRPLPGSRKVYVEGSRPGVRVPMRLVSQSPTAGEAVDNPAFPVYDTSGPNPDRGGFIPLVGEAHLFQGGQQAGKRPTAFHLLDRPFMPVLPAQTRATWVGPPRDTPEEPLKDDVSLPDASEPGTPKDLPVPPVPGKYGLSPYKALSLYPPVFGNVPMAPLVQMPPFKASVTVAIPPIAASGNGYRTAAVPGARPGDLV